MFNEEEPGEPWFGSEGLQLERLTEKDDINIVRLLHLFFMLCMLLFVDAMSLGTVAMRSS